MVSRPRRPLGPDQPGRLQATMLRVLAAEMTDGARFSRGKRIRAEDAVIDLVVGHGAVTARVQGSRPDPYVVTLLARPGRSVPSRGEVTARCTCPDDDSSGGVACKHAIAALLALADEVDIDLAALARWRRTDAAEMAGDGDHAPVTGGSPAPTDDQRRGVPDPSRPDPLAAGLSELLRPPAGARLPAVPVLAALDHTALSDRVVADVLDDALAHLRIRWE